MTLFDLKPTHCNTLQHAATHCNTRDMLSLFDLKSTRCNTLQHIATHYNSLQHTIIVRFKQTFLGPPKKGGTNRKIQYLCTFTQEIPVYIHTRNTCIHSDKKYLYTFTQEIPVYIHTRMTCIHSHKKYQYLYTFLLVRIVKCIQVLVFLV